MKSFGLIGYPLKHSFSKSYFENKFLNENIKVSDLNAIAISSGPGSYTGLRIGTSTAKGLCYACGIPLIAIPTLDAMVQGIKDHYPEMQLCPMIDARRMEVYCAVYSSYQATSVVAKEINKDSFKKELSQVSFNNYDRAEFRMENDLMLKFYEAITQFDNCGHGVGLLLALSLIHI